MSSAAGSGNNKNKSNASPINDFAIVNRKNATIGFSQELEGPNVSNESGSIYMYAGHGEDYCDLGTKKLSEEIVPENCVYVTISKCGESTFIPYLKKGEGGHGLKAGDIELFKKTNNGNIADALNRPWISFNRKLLAKYFGVKQEDIHVKLPGETYVVSRFSPLGLYASLNKMGGIEAELGPSGLLEIDKIQNKEVLNYIPYQRRLFLDKLSSFFSASVFPTEEQAKSIFQKVLPARSLTRVGVRLDELLGANDKIQDEIENLVAEDEEVKTPYDFLSNTYLMKKFPGIHYWTVCRDVAEGCEPAMTARRTISNEQQERLRARENTPESFGVAYDPFANIFNTLTNETERIPNNNSKTKRKNNKNRRKTRRNKSYKHRK